MQDILLKSIFVLVLIFSSCSSNESSTKTNHATFVQQKEGIKHIIPGAERVAKYYPIIKGKTIGLVVNQTSMVGNKHLVDTLINLDLKIKTIFSPEHGFRGKADRGEEISDDVDFKTGLPIVSLYGKKKKAEATDLLGMDYVVFDIQDVGARFYTYINSMAYMMEACAENDIPMIVLDRPNPNGHYVDGPVLDPEFSTFVGLHEVPVVYGMTIGEYAVMVNGEAWLKNGIKCDLTVISCNNYDHTQSYDLPVKPSPNLPNLRSILLYPSLCFFEGTTLSIGRGTPAPFQIIGHPTLKDMKYSFTPRSTEGAKYPVLQDIECFGSDLIELEPRDIFAEGELNLDYLITYYKMVTDKGEAFFKNDGFFDKLAGTDQLRKQIIGGLTKEEIKASWQEGLNKFKKMRSQYLLYPDF